MLSFIYLEYLSIIRVVIQDLLQLLDQRWLNQAKLSITFLRCARKEIVERPVQSVTVARCQLLGGLPLLINGRGSHLSFQRMRK